MDTQQFTSPKSKLVRFFLRSRDGWKTKCLNAKKQRKLLANQVRAVEKSREYWREVARKQRQEIRKLQKQLDQDKKTGEPQPSTAHH